MANMHEEAMKELDISINNFTKSIHSLNERLRAIPLEISKNKYLSETQFEINNHDSAKKYLAIMESLEVEAKSIPSKVDALNEQIKTAQEERARLSGFDMSSFARDDDDLFERCRKLCGK